MESSARYSMTLTPRGFRNESKARWMFAGGALYILAGTSILISLAFAAMVRPETGMILGLLLGFLIAAAVIWIGLLWLRMSLCLAWSRFDLDADAARIIVLRTIWRPSRIEIPATDFGYTIIARPMHVACELGLLTRHGRWLQLAIAADEDRIRYIAEQITTALVVQSNREWRVEPEHIDLVKQLDSKKLLFPPLNMTFTDGQSF